MIIVQPHLCEIDRDNHYTTNLHFLNGVVKPFYMRGSVAWPQGEKEGFAILAGMDLREHKIIIFSQYPFWTVGHWKLPDGNVQKREDGSGWYLGLMEFISKNLSLYKCASYFWGGQSINSYLRFGKQVYSHPQASRRLELIEVPYVAEIGPDLLIEKLKTDQFKGGTVKEFVDHRVPDDEEYESWLDKSVTEFKKTRATINDYDNPTLALMTLLAGFDFAPWVNLEMAA